MMDHSLSDENNKILFEILEGLISVPSVKGLPSPGAPFGIKPAEALTYLLDKAGTLGFRTVDLDGFAGYIEFGEGSKEVAALCHLDIVPPGDGWTCDPYILRSDGGKLIGRGIIDDKGPAVACLVAMKILNDSGWKPKNRIRLILGLDEESGCECIDHYRSVQKPPDIGFTPDAKFPVIYAEKGILHVRFEGHFKENIETAFSLKIDGGDKANMVPSYCRFSIVFPDSGNTNDTENVLSEVYGKSSHASLPQYGENAVSKAISAIHAQLKSKSLSHPFIDFYIDKIAETTDGSLMGVDFSDAVSGDLTFNVGLLSVDDTTFSMTVDIRYPVTYKKHQIFDILKFAAAEYGFSVVEESAMDPLFREPDSDFVCALLDVFNEVTGENRKPIAIGGGTYARRMPNIIAFGPVFDPGRDVAHQANEYILEEDLLKCIEIYKNAFVKLDEII